MPNGGGGREYHEAPAPLWEQVRDLQARYEQLDRDHLKALNEVEQLRSRNKRLLRKLGELAEKKL